MSALKCIKSDVASHSKKTQGALIKGLDKSTYSSWSAMLDRCKNSKCKSFSRYGGRGIVVCERWEKSFENFYADMGQKPDGLTLDRIDNDAGYCKENCRWTTYAVQARNRRSNRLITAFGRTQCQVDWAKEFGLSQQTIYFRLKSGIPAEKAFSPVPPKPVLRLSMHGEILKRYERAVDAVLEGFTASCITGCCKGALKTHRGFKWRYA